jgi:hypothetical protein
MPWWIAMMRGVRIRACFFGVALAFFAAFACLAQDQPPASAQRLPFSATDQQRYLDGLIQNAPADWAHGKHWVLVQPYLIGRNVTRPISRTVCPDAGLVNSPADGSEIPPWIYSAPEICEEMAATHDSALVVLEDPKDMDAAYFLFLACDTKQRRNPCDMDGYYQPDGMKLEESTKRGSREFDVLVPTPDGKTARFLIPEIWHMRNAAPESGNAQ